MKKAFEMRGQGDSSVVEEAPNNASARFSESYLPVQGTSPSLCCSFPIYINGWRLCTVGRSVISPYGFVVVVEYQSADISY